MWQKDSNILYQDFIERISVAIFFIAGSAFFIALTLFVFQIIMGNYYFGRAEENRMYIMPHIAPRGIIVDANGVVVADNELSHGLFFYPFLERTTSFEKTIDRLAGVLRISENSIREMIDGAMSSGKVVQLLRNLTRNELFLIKEGQDALEGIAINEIARRNYKNPFAVSHLLGYTGEAGPQFIERYSNLGYKSGDVIGKTGLESRYDIFLRGDDGAMQFERDVFGRHKRFLRHIKPKQGNKLFISINSDLQKVAYSAIAATERPGAAVAIEPKTGKIRMFVSLPGFDSNTAFLRSEESALFWENAFGDPSKPLLNRVVSGLYPPGSVFKIITLVSALKDANVSEDLRYFCGGKFHYGNQTFRCWREEGHGWVNLEEAFAYSCNVYYYRLGLKTGARNILRQSKLFNLAQKTGFDFPGELRGHLPSEKGRFHAGDSINLAIGQGELVLTPLQLAQLASNIANSGHVMKPYVVERIVSSSGETLLENRPVQTGEIQLDQRTWDILRKYMAATVSYGTGRGSKIDNIAVAGKTGTGQNPHGEGHAWFICFAPAEDPQIALAVLVENAGYGGAVAAPIARKILEAHFGQTQKKQ